VPLLRKFNNILNTKTVIAHNVINVRRRLEGSADAAVSIAADDAASRVFKIYGRLESFADKDLICVID